MEATTPVYITDPLVDDELISYENRAVKRFMKETEDESKSYDVYVSIDTKEMIPTAMMFALKPRLNTTFHVTVYEKVPGASFVYSFLKSSHIEDVVLERQ